MVFGLEKYRQYIEGYHFVVLTDHAALTWLFSQQDVSGRLARWILKLQHFDFDIKYIKGKDHVVPDALSRIPEADIIEPSDPVSDPWYLKRFQEVSENFKVFDRKLFYKSSVSRTKLEQNPWKLVEPKE